MPVPPLTNDGLDILRLVVDVEQVTGAESVRQRVLEGAQVVVHLAGHQRRQMTLRETLLLVENLSVRVTGTG